MKESPLSRGLGLLLAASLAVAACPLPALAENEIDTDTSGESVEEQEEAARPSRNAGNPVADLLNNADLNPANPKSQALDALLDDLMDDILDEDMDTYEQLTACFDYLVDTVGYGSHMSNLGAEIRDGVTCRQVYSSYGAVEGFGAVALTARTGMCNAYASAFILMARKIGLDAYLVKGSTISGGRYVYHEWAEIKIDGQIYLFDPQLDQSLRRAGLPDYSVFCKTYAQVSGRYSK